jgi:hypothetical protein
MLTQDPSPPQDSRMCFRRCRNGVCQRAIARRDEAIVRVLAKQFSLPLETWITMHEDLRSSPRCKFTFEALVQDLQRHVRWSE